MPQLVALESSSIDFVNDLECLDRLSPRSADTVHVFYMKSGQKTADEILGNVVSTCFHLGLLSSSNFLEQSNQIDLKLLGFEPNPALISILP